MTSQAVEVGKTTMRWSSVRKSLRGRFRSVSLAVFGKLPLGLLDQLDKAISWTRGFGFSTGVESEALVLLRLLGPLPQTGGVLLDVGANVGEWSEAVTSLSPRIQVHAFEPSATAFAALDKRFARNPNVSCHNFAIGRNAAVAVLFSDKAGSGLASLTKRRLEHFGMDFSFTENVEITTLDLFCERVAISPIAIKIDVEGHELDVLLGATNVLAGVKLIQFEFGGTDIDTRTFFQDFFYLLVPLGFRLWRHAPKGLVPVTEYSERLEVFFYTNYFAIRD